MFIFLLIAFSRQIFGQTSTNKLADTKWDSNWGGGDWGETFKIKFSASTLTISCGPNTYDQFKYYKLKNDTLIIGGTTKLDPKKLFRPLKNYPTFKVTKADNDSLLIKALNWQAIYITGTLTTPYIDVNYSEFIKDDQKLKPNTDFSQGGVVNDHLDMFKQK